MTDKTLDELKESLRQTLLGISNVPSEAKKVIDAMNDVIAKKIELNNEIKLVQAQSQLLGNETLKPSEMKKLASAIQTQVDIANHMNDANKRDLKDLGNTVNKSFRVK